MPLSRRKKERSQAALASVVKIELLGLLIIVLSLIGLLESGWLGKNVLALLFRFIAGSWDFIIPVLLIGMAIHMMFTRKSPKLTYRVLGIALIGVAILTWDHMILYKQITADGKFAEQSIIKVTWDRIWLDHGQKVSTTGVGGGMIGALFFAVTNGLVGTIGTGLVIVFLFLVGLMFLFNLSYVNILMFAKDKLALFYGKAKNTVKDSVQLLQEESEKRKKEAKESEEARKQKQSEEENGTIAVTALKEQKSHPQPAIQEEEVQQPNAPLIRDFTDRIALDEDEEPVDPSHQARAAQPKTNQEITFALEGEEEIFGTLNTREEQNTIPYELPNLQMLARPKASSTGKDVDHTSNAAKLVQTLKSFGVNATVSEVHRGPAVTRYEVQPATGVKVSRIVSLTDDLALALAAKDIRIEAPIPGKSAIGIEVPNSEVAVVSLREVLEAPEYQDAPGKLTVALGRDISGEPIVADLTKMPHLLVAGATGSGKSVCINGLIMSILFKAKPEEVKLMMVDPKMVELNVYNGIPHLLAPVVTDPRRASVALKKVVAEMERRYNLFAKTGSRNIEMYNAQVEGTPLPYIVVIVDELADLMMVAPGEVEDAICRLAQMARASGIHLIIATQRPSVDVITGVIKANIPSRIAFGVSSMADSRTILDMGGAEKLLGRGDMLSLPMGASKPTRVQGAFVSDKEVEEVVRFVKEQQEVRYNEEMIPGDVQEEQQPVVDDELYDQAVQIVSEAQTASASLLQRRLRVGYTRAARLIDMMEAQGIVGPYEGSKPREVRLPRPSIESNIS
ncbi:FtsK/SpoIIIE family DNA translocase [Brevibacillus porteri]|uniref:Cell division protein FtsK n=1 Tax=Brevibacillus porteri TaxID=2126350 RepID=A0ABX5FLR6_9BACL|nr:DNA translocase FtsK [Brevibacillus porteri]MED1798373.1 DNA translocase FtsK [Brevibacillus porteri]MED2134311.1 DNA translocase FtsK [Brevibacillus porteri]MED2744613.1 DNA translocase FtsK [Brevibacillus porteri]MED2815296.1 DNA translocase FtsK [Brevibacillus porteri]MED2897522.1 DNA translocase FtsK [Brevibacillus porteri]